MKKIIFLLVFAFAVPLFVQAQIRHPKQASFDTGDECSRTEVKARPKAMNAPTFTGLNSNYCSDSAPVILTGSEAPAGVFSGHGITDHGNGTATFDPAAAGPGEKTINYTYTPDSWAQVRGGENYMMAIKTNGTLWGWGRNVYGQLGNGSIINSDTPVQTGTDNDWVSISPEGGFTLAIKANGTLWSWGRNQYGQLGNGNNSNSNTPIQIGTENDWASVSAGENHSMAIKNDGTLWSWGYNSNGELGDGTNTSRDIPVQIGTDNDWAKVSTREYHNLAIKTNGTLWAWGANLYGQLGNGNNSKSNIPIQIGTDNDWADITTGSDHSLAIKTNGTLWAWGWNFFGQLGNGNNSNNNLPIPIGTDNDWAGITAGSSHSLAIKTNGTLWAWGGNLYGQLGQGNNIYSNIPLQIGTDNDWTDLSTGSSHSAALKSNGMLWTWGYNSSGQLGNGNNSNSNTPLQIGNLPVPVTVSQTTTVYAVPAEGVLYVNATATGANNGYSWTDAFTNLQDALSLADKCSSVSEIWVATGMYKPTTGTDRAISFVMRNGLGIYGGFDGTETDRDDRDWVANVTTLSGDIGMEDVNTDNSYNVIFNNDNGLDQTAVLDGFEITGGNANSDYPNSRGGGIFNVAASPNISNCTFYGNSAEYGGGMSNSSASPNVTNCAFDGNSASLYGGGMYNTAASAPNLIHCSFYGNSAGIGGGIANVGSSPDIINCRFTGNTASSGGAMDNSSGSNATIINSIFLNNLASTGGAIYNVNSNPELTNCTFSGNSAAFYGGMRNNYSAPTVKNCIFWGNGGEIETGAAPTVSHSIVQGGYAGDNNKDEDPLFADPANGDFHLSACSPAIDAGTAAGAPDDDLDGNPRPFPGTTIDMGAYEYQGIPAPTVAACRNITVYLNQLGEATFAAEELDNGSTGCGLLSFSTDGQTDAAAYVNCENVGDNMVTLFVTNAYGQPATCTATVTVLDTFPPTIDCGAVNPIRFAAPGTCSFTVTGHTGGLNPPHNDFCGVDIVNNYNNTHTLNGATFPVGITPVLWTATDPSGNSASCTVNVTVIDNQPPVATCFDQTIAFNGEEQIVLNSDDLVEADDNCGIAGIELSPPTITCAQLGQVVPVTAVVTDPGNNTAACAGNITVTGLPCGWSHNSGSVGCGSTVAFAPSTGAWTATSTGCYYADPYTNDAVTFAQRQLCGNGSITARVTSIGGVGGWAGATMRETNATGAKKVQLMTNLSNFVRAEVRYTTGGQAYPADLFSFQRFWVRIAREGNEFTGFVSSDGNLWIQTFSVLVPMNSCIQMGLVMTNFLQNGTGTATFDNVSTTGSSVPPLVWGIEQGAESIESIEQPHGFEVYPNPTSGELNVDMTQYMGRAVRLEVYSLEGKLLRFSEIDEVQTALERLDLSAFQSGMYLVKVRCFTRDGISHELPDATRRVVLAR